MSCRSRESSRFWAMAIPGRAVAAPRAAMIILRIIQFPLLSGPIRRKELASRHPRFLMISPDRRGNAIVSFMKAYVAKYIREPQDIIQAKPVGIEGVAVYMKHASTTGEHIPKTLRPSRKTKRRT